MKTVHALLALAAVLLGGFTFAATPTPTPTYILATPSPTVTYIGPCAGAQCGGSGGSTNPVCTTNCTPTQASANGFNTLTFSTTAFSANNVDVNAACNTSFGSCAQNKQWYKCNMVSSARYTAVGDLVFPGDGSLLMNGGTLLNTNGTVAGTNGQNCEIASAVRNSAGTNFIGVAFGGGYYAEVTAKFPNNNNTVGWPAIWTLTLEGSAVYVNTTCPLPGSNGAYSCPQWPNQTSGFSHQIENDWLEYINGNVGNALHESFGVYDVSCGNPSASPPTGTKPYCTQNTGLPHYAIGDDHSAYHKYGMLWVPATSTAKGYTEIWYDGVEQTGSKTSYAQLPPTGTSTGYGFSPYIPSNLPNFCGGVANSTSCGVPTWAYAIHDLLHHVLLIGTNPITGAFPMQIQSVNVWQRNAASNITQGINVAAPTITPAAGSYPAPLTVTIAAQAGATIQYTTNGTAPTSSSPVYPSGGIVLSTGGQTTVQAIATISGVSSAATSAIYTISTACTVNCATGATLVFNYTNFATAGSNISYGGNGLGLQGTTIDVGNTFQHTAAGAYATAKQNIQTFSTDFTFQLPNASLTSLPGQPIIGFAFGVQNSNTTTMAPCSYGFCGNRAATDSNMDGFGAYLDQISVNPSVYTKFEVNPHLTYRFDSHDGLHSNSLGIYTNGGPYAALTPEDDIEHTGIDFTLGHQMAVNIVFDGTYETLKVRDTVTGAQMRKTWPINIPVIVGGSTAYVGFSGGQVQSGGAHMIVTAWDYYTGYNTRVNAPTFTLTGTNPVSVRIVGPTGSTVYYRTDGLEPTTNDTNCGASCTVSASSNEVIKAVTVQSGYTDSLVATKNIVVATNPSINCTNLGTCSSVSIVGSAYINGSSIQLTDASNPQTGAFWYGAPVSINTFTDTFTFNATSVSGTNNDGFAWVLQNPNTIAASSTYAQGWIVGGPQALGQFGIYDSVNGYGWAGCVANCSTATHGDGGNIGGFPTSAAIIFDLDANVVGLYTGPQVPGSANTTVGNGVSLRAGHNISTTIQYNGSTLTLTLTDSVTSATWSKSWTVNLQTALAAETAYDGFTSASNGMNAKFSSWTHSP